MRLTNEILLYLYRKKLFGVDFKTACIQVAKHFKLSPKELKLEVARLQRTGKIALSNGKVVEGKNAPHFVAQNVDLFTENRKTLLAGSIIKREDEYLFKCLKNGQLYKVVPTDEVIKSVGKRVCCEIDLREEEPIAVLDKTFGFAMDPIQENILIAYSYGFTTKFSPEVMQEVAQIPQEVTEKDMIGRVDMTDKYFMPWDPATCKDKDDAIYAEKTKAGYKVYVAIADVSHYVKSGTALDQEAMRRGNSCYLGSGVYPMLPPELSNGICSLNDNVKRLSLVAIIDIDEKGQIIKYKFEKAVIKIKQSFCYEDVEKVHLCQDGYHVKYSEAKPYVDILYDVADILEEKLKNRHFIRIENDEPRFRFNDTLDTVVAVEPQGKEKSHMVVEQLMILANEATAKFFKDNQLEGIFRVHQGISDTNLALLNRLLQRMGLKHKVDYTAESAQNFINFAKKCHAKDFLLNEFLRSLSKARYSELCEYHFGLGSRGYTHFTSPIRRYADTLAHRIISEYLNHNMPSLTSADIQIIAEHLNEQEKKAMKAENLSDRFLTCMWAKQHVGEQFEGVVFEITSTSVVIKKDVLYVEIPFAELNKIHNYKKMGEFALQDRMTGKKLQLGDKFTFTISQVDEKSYSIKALPSQVKVEQLEKEWLKKSLFIFSAFHFFDLTFKLLHFAV